MKLRDYQQINLHEIVQGFEHHQGVFYTLPTGGGKTVVIGGLIQHYLPQGATFALLAHREELLTQAHRTIDTLTGIDAGIIQAGDSTRPNSPIQLCSIQSMRTRGLPFAPDFIITDEAHLCKAKSYMDFYNAYAEAKRLFVSATPCGLDGRGFHDVASLMVHGPQIHHMVERQYLAPPVVYTGSHIAGDLKGIKKQAGDYAVGALSSMMQGVQLMGDVVEQYFKYGAGRKGVVFCVDVNHSKSVATAFNQAGIKAEHIDGAMSKIERQAILQRLKTGETTIVSNCNILCEGWDEPTISYVALARPTKSLALYVQQAGRGLRLAEGKANCVIMDHANNTAEHGHVMEHRDWSLEGKKYKEKHTRNYKECPACGSWESKTAERCLSCGYKWQKREREIITVKASIGQWNDAKAIESHYVNCLKLAKKKGYKAGWAWRRVQDKWGAEACLDVLNEKSHELKARYYDAPQAVQLV